MNTSAHDGVAIQQPLAVPHFVGIGVPRCGTSWVFNLLRLHPGIWMPWKEVHYFDSIDPGTKSGYDIASRRFRLAKGWRYILQRLTVRAIPGARTLLRRMDPAHAAPIPGFRWSARYLFGTVSPAWYEGLFDEGEAEALRCGEITPAYCTLSEEGIAGFARLLPQVRTFLLLRNPLEWAWSGLCRDVRKAGRRPEELTISELIAACPVPTGRSRQDFGSNLRRWQTHFSRERLLVCFHEEIRSDPGAFMDRLCAFIGAGSYPQRFRGLLTGRVNSSARGTAMPAALERYVAERYREQTDIVAELAGGPAVRWAENMRTILRR